MASQIAAEVPNYNVLFSQLSLSHQNKNMVNSAEVCWEDQDKSKGYSFTQQLFQQSLRFQLFKAILISNANLNLEWKEFTQPISSKTSLTGCSQCTSPRNEILTTKHTNYLNLSVPEILLSGWLTPTHTSRNLLDPLYKPMEQANLSSSSDLTSERSSTCMGLFHTPVA